MKKYIADAITGLRIICSILMLHFPVYSLAFCFLYLFAGFTDMVDGMIARETNTVSKSGERLDTIADFLFIAVCMGKILPLLHVPWWLWMWIALIAVLKAGNIVRGILRRRKVIVLHTVLNKVTGLLLFLFPLTLRFVEFRCASAAVCIMATLAGIHEWYCIGTGRGED